MIILSDRSIIEIAGDDRIDFLQNLITNDIKLCKHNNILYSAILNPVGRFFCDFFIINKGDRFYVDCSIYEVENLIKKFNIYKLRSNVIINKNSNIYVLSNHQNQGYQDPRSIEMGFRLYIDKDDIEKFQINYSLIDYHSQRIDLKIPDGYYDLTKDKSFFLEFNFDNLQAISYQKGCYIGQEVTARTHYKGQIRKKLFKFIIENVNDNSKLQINNNSIENLSIVSDDEKTLINIKNHELIYKENDFGILLSAIFDKSTEKIYGLCLIKEDFAEINNKISLNILDNFVNIMIYA